MTDNIPSLVIHVTRHLGQPSLRTRYMYTPDGFQRLELENPLGKESVSGTGLVSWVGQITSDVLLRSSVKSEQPSIMRESVK